MPKSDDDDDDARETVRPIERPAVSYREVRNLSRRAGRVMDVLDSVNFAWHHDCSGQRLISASRQYSQGYLNHGLNASRPAATCAELRPT